MEVARKNAMLTISLWWLMSTFYLSAQAANWPDAMLDDACLHDVSFADANHGWAVGDRGAILHTDNGGVDWRLQTSGVSCPLWSVDFVDAEHGVAVGGATVPYLHRSRGVVLTTRDGGTTWEERPNPTIPTLFEVQMQTRADGMAAGATAPMYPAGLFVTKDGGRIWSGLPLSRPGSLDSPHQRILDLIDNGTAPGKSGFEFETIAEVGGRIWLAGSPGTRIFRSDDRGQTWQSFATGQPLPIEALAFADADLGWAVGALGTVLVTRDGGTTWQAQRGEGRRLAALVVCSDQDEIPFAETAALAAVDGYRTHLLVVTHTPSDRPFEVNLDARLHEAASSVAAHGATLWSDFRTSGSDRRASSVLPQWHAAHTQRGLSVTSADLLTQRLSAAIRMWRPDVVYYAQPSTRPGPRSIHEIIAVALDAAVTASADDQYFRVLSEECSLDTWQVGAVTALSHIDNVQGVSPTSRLSVALGRGSAELASAAQALVVRHPNPLTVFQPFSAAGSPVKLTSGLRGSLGCLARRAAVEVGHGNFAQISLQAQRARQIESMIGHLSCDKAEIQSTQIIGLTGQLDPQRAAHLLVRLGAELERIGHWQLALETWQLVEKQYSGSPLSRFAWQQQWMHVTSAEIQARKKRPPRNASGLVAKTVSVRTSLDQADPENLVDERDRLDERVPAVFRQDPALEFARLRGVAAHRSAQRDRLWKRLARATSDTDWRACAQSELAFHDPSRSRPKPLIEAAAGARPILDGELSDPLWETAGQIVVGGDHDSAKTVVRVAKDLDHLYVAIVASKSVDANYAHGSEPRVRDANLETHDRVRILLDVDRDYQTGWELEVDHRGWGAERLRDDSRWDPDWYIAQLEDRESWTIELAIPLAELTVELADRERWGFGIQRLIPDAEPTGWPNLPGPWAWHRLGYLQLN